MFLDLVVCQQGNLVFMSKNAILKLLFHINKIINTNTNCFSSVDLSYSNNFNINNVPQKGISNETLVTWSSLHVAEVLRNVSANLVFTEIGTLVK